LTEREIRLIEKAETLNNYRTKKGKSMGIQVFFEDFLACASKIIPKIPPIPAQDTIPIKIPQRTPEEYIATLAIPIPVPPPKPRTVYALFPLVSYSL